MGENTVQQDVLDGATRERVVFTDRGVGRSAHLVDNAQALKWQLGESPPGTFVFLRQEDILAVKYRDGWKVVQVPPGKAVRSRLLHEHSRTCPSL